MEALQGYRKWIIYCVGVVILGILIWFKPEHITTGMDAYILLSGVVIIGNEAKKAIDVLRNKKEEIKD